MAERTNKPCFASANQMVEHWSDPREDIELAKTEIDVEGHLSILKLDGEYARSWDTGDAAAWAALFTEDGAYETGFGSGPTSGAQGRKGLEEFCRSTVAANHGIHLPHSGNNQHKGGHRTHNHCVCKRF